MNTHEFCTAHGLTMTATKVADNPTWISDGRPVRYHVRMDHWKVVLTRRGSRFTTHFSMGDHGKAPEVADVLDCLASDAASIENSKSFEDWAFDLGYDPDSRRHERIYKMCHTQAMKLKRFLGEDLYHTLLWDIERL